jgi:hypothetical protein
MNLFATSLGMVRNFQRALTIPSGDQFDTRVALAEEGQAVREIERDGKVAVDLKFGSIKFKRGEGGSLACALIDVLVDGDEPGGTRVQMDVKVPADPQAESLLAVTDKCRTRIIATLRAAADTFEATSADDLLFHEGES